MAEDSWASARTDFEQHVLPKLDRHGRRIGMQASKGGLLAQRIVGLYKMLHRSFDPVTCMLLEKAVDAWLKDNPVE